MDRANAARSAADRNSGHMGARHAPLQNPHSVREISPLAEHNFSPIRPNSDAPRVHRETSASSTSVVKDQTNTLFYDPAKPNLGWQVVEMVFGPKRFELETKLYRYLGVHLFKGALMGTLHTLTSGMLREGGLRKSKVLQSHGNYYLMGQSESGMRSYCRATLIPEILHGVFAIHSAISFYKALHSSDSTFFGIACAAAYPVINAYCVMLQRYNRARVARVLSKASSRG